MLCNASNHGLDGRNSEMKTLQVYTTRAGDYTIFLSGAYLEARILGPFYLRAYHRVTCHSG